MFVVVSKLKDKKHAIKRLARGTMDIQAQDVMALKSLMEYQQQLQLDILSTELRNQEQSAAENYKRVHKKYVEFLRQKARAAWIKGGDDNTRLFHQAIK